MKSLSAFEVSKIIHLLKTTELTFPQIAQRMNCSKGAVQAINEKFKVREYAGRRLWQISA